MIKLNDKIQDEINTAQSSPCTSVPIFSKCRFFSKCCSTMYFKSVHTMAVVPWMQCLAPARAPPVNKLLAPIIICVRNCTSCSATPGSLHPYYS
eukprot:1148091-Pelagomonas_calceolata.AAC.6